MTSAAPLTVVPLVAAVRALAPVRAGLGVLALLAALAVGAKPASAVLAFVVGAVAGGAFLTGDRRGIRRRLEEPPPLPEGSIVDGSWLVAVRAGVWPSTVVVTAMSLAALAFEPTLAAGLAGVVAGMALATLVGWAELRAREQRLGGTLLAERSGSRLFLSPREPSPGAG
jgi:hypothetical protein